MQVKRRNALARRLSPRPAPASIRGALIHVKPVAAPRVSMD